MVHDWLKNIPGGTKPAQQQPSVTTVTRSTSQQPSVKVTKMLEKTRNSDFFAEVLKERQWSDLSVTTEKRPENGFFEYERRSD